VEVIVAQTEQGRGVLGVIDGSSPKGVETTADAGVAARLLAQNRIQEVRVLAALLLIAFVLVAPAAAQNRFEQLDRDLNHAADRTADFRSAGRGG